MPDFQPYWIYNQDAKATASVQGLGSGLRRVNVAVGRKWVSIRPIIAPKDSVKVTAQQWDDIPHLLWDSYQTFSEVLDFFRAKRLNKQGDQTCQVQSNKTTQSSSPDSGSPEPEKPSRASIPASRSKRVRR